MHLYSFTSVERKSMSCWIGLLPAAALPLYKDSAQATLALFQLRQLLGTSMLVALQCSRLHTTSIRGCVHKCQTPQILLSVAHSQEPNRNYVLSFRRLQHRCQILQSPAICGVLQMAANINTCAVLQVASTQMLKTTKLCCLWHAPKGLWGVRTGAPARSVAN